MSGNTDFWHNDLFTGIGLPFLGNNLFGAERKFESPEKLLAICSPFASLSEPAFEASVAQSGRASPCQAECRGVESLRSLHLLYQSLINYSHNRITTLHN